MRKFLLVLALLAVCVIALGIYQDWFQFSRTSDKGSGKIDVGVTIDENKIKEDVEKAKEKAKAAGDKAKDSVEDTKPAPSKGGATQP